MCQKYSFLMSVYYKENPEYLEESIKSVLNQTIVPDEIVIVEDGKLGFELEEIVKKYETRYSNLINVIRRKENRGLGYSLNEGLKKCKNELVVRMDSDDICIDNRCEKQLKRFKECPQLVILGTQIYEFQDSKDNIISQRIVPVSYDEIIKFSHRRSPFNHPTVMFKKSIILKNGGYPTKKRKEDLELFVRLVNNNYYCENLSDNLLYYRTSKDNLDRRRNWINCKEYIEIMFSFYKQKIIKLNDFLFVLIGQLSFYILPSKILNILNSKFLRK